MAEDDLDAIARLQAEAIEARQHLRQKVQVARDNGRSWGQIAMVLRVSKQAAWERFGR